MTTQSLIETRSIQELLSDVNARKENRQLALIMEGTYEGDVVFSSLENATVKVRGKEYPVSFVNGECVQGWI